MLPWDEHLTGEINNMARDTLNEMVCCNNVVFTYSLKLVAQSSDERFVWSCDGGDTALGTCVYIKYE